MWFDSVSSCGTRGKSSLWRGSATMIHPTWIPWQWEPVQLNRQQKCTQIVQCEYVNTSKLLMFGFKNIERILDIGYHSKFSNGTYIYIYILTMMYTQDVKQPNNQLKKQKKSNPSLRNFDEASSPLPVQHHVQSREKKPSADGVASASNWFLPYKPRAPRRRLGRLEEKNLGGQLLLGGGVGHSSTFSGGFWLC